MSQKDREAPTGRQIAAARALLGMGQAALAEAAAISVPTLKRMEASDGPAAGMTNNVRAVIGALEEAGVRFMQDVKLPAGSGYDGYAGGFGVLIVPRHGVGGAERQSLQPEPAAPSPAPRRQTGRRDLDL